MRNLLWTMPSTPWRRRASAAVAELSRAVVERRQEICKAENFGLTKLYNLVDDGAYADLRKLHRQLDEAVAACYGWPKSVAQDGPKIVRRLTQLNRDITEGTRSYNPFVKEPAAQPVWGQLNTNTERRDVPQGTPRRFVSVRLPAAACPSPWRGTRQSPEPPSPRRPLPAVPPGSTR